MVLEDGPQWDVLVSIIHRLGMVQKGDLSMDTLPAKTSAFDHLPVPSVP